MLLSCDGDGGTKDGYDVGWVRWSRLIVVVVVLGWRRVGMCGVDVEEVIWFFTLVI